MDGWQLASEVRNDPVLERTPLVLMSPTGLSTGDAKMKLLRWFDVYMNKPVKPSELARSLEELTAGDIEELEAVDGDPTPASAGVPADDALSTVLVAEDHFVNQQLFQTILQKQGFRTILASDGEEAIEALKGNPGIGLIFMDVQMPKMNGYDAAARIRDMGIRTPIVGVTANALSGERERCLRVGMNEYISKPFRRSDIEGVIHRLRGEGAFARGVGRRAESDAPIRFAETVDAFMGDAETAERVTRSFAERIAGQLEELRAMIEAGRLSDARVTVHAIKGGAWNLYASDLGEAARRVEDACAREDASDAAGLLSSLCAEADRFVAYIASVDLKMSVS
jgi:CheY-like chemotaxis protein